MTNPRIAIAALIVLACAAARPVHAAPVAEVQSRVFGIDKSQALELDGKRRFTLISTEEIVVTDALQDGQPLRQLSITSLRTCDNFDKLLRLISRRERHRRAHASRTQHPC